jgi:hypothetical protein
MAGDDPKRIERRARSLLLSKEISSAKKDIVRSIMQNTGLESSERWKAIIELVQNCPDKKPPKIIEAPAKPKPNAAPLKKKEEGAASAETSAPTETSYYIDQIHNKYRHLKLFKKRYLARRSNHMGFGLRKRLVPSKRFLRLLEYIALFNERIVVRLNQVLMTILNDPQADDPLYFNYLRAVRRWLISVPLIRLNAESVKWLERQQFEREFGGFIKGFYSFIKISPEMREGMLLEVELRLRSADDLKKDEMSELDADDRARKEKETVRDKEIYNYIMLLRSYLPSVQNEDSVLTRFLNKKYKIDGLSQFLYAVSEALVFQREVTLNEICAHFEITQPVIRRDKWDYSEDLLKKFGKDFESRKTKRREELRAEIAGYDTLNAMLQFDINGRNALIGSVNEYWRVVEKKRQDPKMLYREDYLGFLNILLIYFRGVYMPLLDGSVLILRDRLRSEYEGSLFSINYFHNEIVAITKLSNELNSMIMLKKVAPITRDDALHAGTGDDGITEEVSRIMMTAGDNFYQIAKAVMRVYDAHCEWIKQGGASSDKGESRRPINMTDDEEAATAPMPFFDCTIQSVDPQTVFTRLLQNRALISDSLEGGIFIEMMAFCCQFAHECLNARILRDIEIRKSIIRELDSLA